VEPSECAEAREEIRFRACRVLRTWSGLNNEIFWHKGLRYGTKALMIPLAVLHPFRHRIHHCADSVRRGRSILFALALLCAGAGSNEMVGGDADVDFNRDVRPILSRNCFSCHGPDEQARKGGLRLDVRAASVGEPGSQAVIIPGRSEESELIYRVFSEDSREVMPPASANAALTAEQKETLRAWVSSGAEYRPHWAFLAPERAGLPEVEDPDWVRNPIDRFILAKLKERGMEPSQEADRSTLARRVYLDLVGYPPTLEELRRFVEDESQDAYERMVDELLASPHYGERWARLWMDLARYADTNGYEKDRPRSIWPWRDWVIDALNRDMPFDQFTIEQLAGDMLPEAGLDQRIATGFHRNSMINEEGGADPLEFRYHAVVDRVAVTGTTWMGLTVGCAQCHTHKFDPITHKEYFQFMALLNNADEPELVLPNAGIDEQRRAQEEKITALIRALDTRWPVESTRWHTIDVHANAESGVPIEKLDDRSIRFGGEAADQDSYVIEFDAGVEEIEALRIEVLPDEQFPHRGPGRSESGNFVLSGVQGTVRAAAGDGEEVPLRFVRAEADVAQKGFLAEHVLDGDPATGWAVAVGGDWHVRRSLRLWLDSPIGSEAGAKIRLILEQRHGEQQVIGRLRVSVGEPEKDSRPESERRAELVGRAFERWLMKERARTVDWDMLEPVLARGSLPLLTILPDGSVLASGDQSKSDTYDVRFAGDLQGVTAIRLETLPDDRLPRGGPGRVYYEGPAGEFFLSELTADVNGEPQPFVRATDSHTREGAERPYAAALAIDGDPQSGWTAGGRVGESSHAVFEFASPLEGGEELRLSLLFERYYAAGLGRFRVWVTRAEGPVSARDLSFETEELLRRPADRLTVEEEQRLRTAFLLSAPELAAAQREIRDQRRSLPSHPTTLVLAERPPENPRVTRMYHRGEFLEPGEEVEPGVPSVLPDLPADGPRDRLSLARWLVSEDNPLTARVTVNRQWAAVFGEGLVRTVGDFGFQGELPTHPELLDWLAVEFREDGWSLKRLHRLLVTSATYRQSSRTTPKQLMADPDNRWLSWGPRRRLEAEMIRDSVLRVSGLLSGKMGGPSVFPPQPPGITTDGAYGPLEWKVSDGEDRYRRGLYTFMKRTAPYAMFTTFDAPSGESCVARRDVSNTPLQALTALNDEVIVEAAQALGRQIAAGNGSPADKLERLFLRSLTRLPSDDERRMALDFWESQRLRFAHGDLDPADLGGEGEGQAERAAWVALARVLMNVDEFLTRG
jgi:mono/diheme cytochrome c family protein